MAVGPHRAPTSSITWCAPNTKKLPCMRKARWVIPSWSATTVGAVMPSCWASFLPSRIASSCFFAGHSSPQSVTDHSTHRTSLYLTSPHLTLLSSSHPVS
jgi:hypothetical protein